MTHRFALNDTNKKIGRDPSATLLQSPRHLRLSCFERASHRRESADDDTLRSRHMQRIAGTNIKGGQVQVSVLS